ncbi:hypothetical protein RB597_003292 [Gaeumannomyces tritici]
MFDNCNRFHLVKSGDSCGAIQSTSSFRAITPASASWGSQTTRPPTTTTRGNGVSTPTLIQPVMVGNCKTFHLDKA